MISKKWPGTENITLRHIQKAAKLWKRDPSKFSFRESRKYDVWIDDAPYPPKAISAIAYQLATATELTPSDFAGLKDGFWHKILKNHGLAIVSKNSEAALTFQAEALHGLADEELDRRVEETSTLQPQKYSITTVVYERSPAVRAAAIRRADGRCETCKKVPFYRIKTGTPYLQVHHKQPLSRGGADNLANTIALCPNCHCKAHDDLGIPEGDE